VTVSNELGEARYPTAANKIKARRVKPAVVEPGSLGVEAEDLSGRVAFTRQFVPTVQGNCEFIEGATPAEIADQLIGRLRADGVIR
jgi:electron transfer flavoprotein beta subunit